VANGIKPWNELKENEMPRRGLTLTVLMEGKTFQRVEPDSRALSILRSSMR
jgi:hypothetical protein